MRPPSRERVGARAASIQQLTEALLVVTGRLDNLVDKAYDRFKDRFFVQETVMVERFGER